MYYILYLASMSPLSTPYIPIKFNAIVINPKFKKKKKGLCRRRHWPEPHYESFPSPSPSPTSHSPPAQASIPGQEPGPGGTGGYTCIVRVNNREYQTDTTFASESLARENAAMRAYLICRNFSVNDGMYPVGHDHGGVVQGIPVAIGTGRGRRKTSQGGSSSDGGRDGDDTSMASSSSSVDFSGLGGSSGGGSGSGGW